jgi:hypothetical protein
MYGMRGGCMRELGGGRGQCLDVPGGGGLHAVVLSRAISFQIFFDDNIETVPKHRNIADARLVGMLLIKAAPPLVLRTSLGRGRYRVNETAASVLLVGH